MKQTDIKQNGNTILTVLLPSNWYEITRQQMLFLVKQSTATQTPEQIKLKFFLHIIGARKFKTTPDGSFLIKLKKGKYLTFDPEALTAVANTFDYLFIKTNEGYSFNPQSSINLFKTINILGFKFTGPENALVNFKYDDFINLMLVLDNHKNDTSALFNHLYNPKNKRLPHFLFRFVSPYVKIAVYWFIIGCLKQLEQTFPIVFSGSGGKAKSVADGQMRIIDALADNDVTKKQAVRNSDLYEALYTMQIAAENAEKQRKQQNTL